MFSSVLERLNDRRSAAGEAGEDAGFTLIELMVVLLILAILLAIAIPTFLGVTGGANDRASQSNLNTALTNAKAEYQTNSQSYNIGAGPDYQTPFVAQMSSNEPSLTWVTDTSTSQGVISVSVDADGQGIVLAATSKNNNNCWYVFENEATESGNPAGATAPGTFYGVTKAPTSCLASSPGTPTIGSGAGFPPPPS